METGTSTATSALTSIDCIFQTNSDVFLKPFLPVFLHPSLPFVYVAYDAQQGAGDLKFYPEGFISRDLYSCDFFPHALIKKYRSANMI